MLIGAPGFPPATKLTLGATVIFCLLLAALARPAGAQDLLGPFEAALDDRRFVHAAGLVEWLPQGPEKLLALAELSTVTGRGHLSYASTDQLSPARLTPRLQAKYFLIRARQEEVASRHGPSREGVERLLRDGLNAQPSAHDRAELLKMQLSLAREDKNRAEKIIGELFKISPTAGFEGRLRMLGDDDQADEALALYQVLEERALATDRLALALDYRLAGAFIHLRSGRAEAAVAALTSVLDLALESGETTRVPLALIYLSWSRQELDGTGITTEIFDSVIGRMKAGLVALETLWLAQRKFPQEPRYFEQGLAMARALRLPMVEAAFLLQKADNDESLAASYRRQARELVRGLDLRGVGDAWYGDALSNSIYAVGLDTDDDSEIWPRYLELLESGRTEGEIREFWSAMLGGLPDRQAAWLWFEPLVDSILQRSAHWKKRERAAVLLSAMQLLRRS